MSIFVQSLCSFQLHGNFFIFCKRYIRSPGRDIELFSLQFFISLPQDRKSFPQVSKSLPQDTKSFPQVSKSLPQDTKLFPQVSKSLPQVRKSLPQVSKVVPTRY